MSHQVLRGLGYIGPARPQNVTPSFELSLYDLCQLVRKKMSTTRRPLGSLASCVNVKGEEELTRRAGREWTPMDRHTIRMHARREQAWRPLNRYRVASFIRLFILCLVEMENGHRVGRVHPTVEKMLKKTLAKRIIPFICRRLVYTMDESVWIITLEQFKELDHYLVA